MHSNGGNQQNKQSELAIAAVRSRAAFLGFLAQ
jgi:hypothetical protein